MANVFSNPLVLAETVAGAVIDQRSVILYSQIKFDEAKKEIIDEKTNAANAWMEENLDTSAFRPTIEDFVKKQQLKELFTGKEFSYLTDITGFTAWGISYMNAEVDISSQLCDHPIETGAVITDAAIRNPVSAKVEIVMPTAFYEKLYKQIYDYYENKTPLMLLTKFALYQNLVITDMPYKLEHNSVDRPSIILNLREVMEVVPEYEDMPANYNEGKGITEERALTSDDTNMEVIGQKRYITSEIESLNV